MKPIIVTQQYSDNAIVVWINPTNPKVPGTGAHERWKRHVVGKSIGWHLDYGMLRGDFKWNLQRGYVAVVQPGWPA